MIQRQKQTFNHGVAAIYAVENQAQPGKMPADRLVLKKRLRYQEKTVGLNRISICLQNNVKVDKYICCAYSPDISTQDVAVLSDGQQYKIMQIQKPENEAPPIMNLTLERVAQKYGLP